VIFSALLLVAFAKIKDLPMVGVPPKADVAAERTLKFVAKDSLHISVLDLNDNLLAKSSENSNGFLGVVYSAFERERIKKRVYTNNPLRLVNFVNGRLVLIDDVTGLEIQLSSFGEKNAEVFGKLLIE
jgi:putative photosynthetic complex assembly protein